MFKFNKQSLECLLGIKSYHFISELNKEYSLKLENPVIIELRQIQPLYTQDLDFLYFGLEVYDGELTKWCLLEEALIKKFIFSNENKLEKGNILFLKQSRTVTRSILNKCSMDIRNVFDSEIILLMDFYLIGSVNGSTNNVQTSNVASLSLFSNAVYMHSNPNIYTKLNSVCLQRSGDLINVMGVVIDIEGSTSIAGAVSTKCFKFELMDNTNSRLKVVVWGKKSEEINLNNEDICIINNGKIKFFLNKPVLYITNESSITRVPELHSSEMIEDLRSWLKENKTGKKPNIKIYN